MLRGVARLTNLWSKVPWSREARRRRRIRDVARRMQGMPYCWPPTSGMEDIGFSPPPRWPGIARGRPDKRC
jgi:hypothetical protein